MAKDTRSMRPNVSPVLEDMVSVFCPTFEVNAMQGFSKCSNVDLHGTTGCAYIAGLKFLLLKSI